MTCLKLTSPDFEEILMDTKKVQTLFAPTKQHFTCNFMDSFSTLGIYSIEKQQKGEVFLTHNYTRFTQNIVTKGFSGLDMISLCFVRQGNACEHIHHNQEILIPSSSYNIFFMRESYEEKEVYFKNEEQTAVSLHLPVPYFEQLVNRYPDLLGSAYLRYLKGESFYLNKNYTPITPQMQLILSQIENAEDIGISMTPYIDSKILELLYLQFQPQLIPFAPLRRNEIEKIHEAANILLADIQHTPSLRKLSRQVGINEKKLEQGFHEVFQNTVFGYLFEHKMQLAVQLLRDTSKTITEICFDCGYEYPSHFSAAFKRRFGLSPNQFRKKTEKEYLSADLQLDLFQNTR